MHIYLSISSICTEFFAHLMPRCVDSVTVRGKPQVFGANGEPTTLSLAFELDELCKVQVQRTEIDSSQLILNQRRKVSNMEGEMLYLKIISNSVHLFFMTSGHRQL